MSLLRQEVLGWNSPHSTSLAFGKIGRMCCWGSGLEGGNFGKQLGSAAGEPSASPPPALSPSRGVGDARALPPEDLVSDSCGGICCCAWPERGKEGPLHAAGSAFAVLQTGAGPAAAPAGGCPAGLRGVLPGHGHPGGCRQRLCPSCPHLPAVPLARFLSSSNIEGRRADGSAPRPPPRSPPPSRWRRAGGAPRLARGAG